MIKLHSLEQACIVKAHLCLDLDLPHLSGVSLEGEVLTNAGLN